MSALAVKFRECRVLGKQLLGIEPRIPTRARRPLEFHGNAYGGWSIVRDSLGPAAVVIDAGLGEDVSFSESIITKYGCVVHGFDPTPRAIRYVTALGNPRLRLHEYGVGAAAGRVRFYLPNDEAHVSGSILAEPHLGRASLDVDIMGLRDVFGAAGAETVDLLKLDVEGAEYDIIASDTFAELAPRVRQLCVEFHHRWPDCGKGATERAVGRLKSLGFECAWQNRESNEEFTFVNERA